MCRRCVERRMDEDATSSFMASVGLDAPGAQRAFVKQLLALRAQEKQLLGDGNDHQVPVRMFDHAAGAAAAGKFKQRFTVHGARDVQLATQAGVVSPHGVEHLHTGGESKSVDHSISSIIPSMRISERDAKKLVQYCVSLAGKRVEIFERARSGISYTLAAAGSPGSCAALEDVMGSLDADDMVLPSTSEGVVVAVRLTHSASTGGRVLGSAYLDPARRELVLGEMAIDDCSRLEELEVMLVSIQARELLCCESDFSPAERRVLSEILADINVARTHLAKKAFSDENVESDLDRLAGGAAAKALFVAHGVSLSSSKGACAALISYLGLHVYDAESRVERYGLRYGDLGSMNVLLLDQSALRALNVFPQTASEHGRTGSLFGYMNVCVTAMGSRALRRLLAQPSRDIGTINTRLDRVEALMTDSVTLDSIRTEHLKRMPDVAALCRKLRRDPPTASLQDLVRLYQFSIRLPLLADTVRLLGCKQFEQVSTDLRQLSGELDNFEALIETTIDLDLIDQHEFVISSSVDVQLGVLQQSRDELIEQIALVHTKVERQLLAGSSGSHKSRDQQGAGLVKLERRPALGYEFRLTRTDEKLIRDKPSVYIVTDTKKDGVRFTTKELQRLNTRYVELSDEYESKQAALKKKTVQVASTYVPVFEDAAVKLAELDVICAFAHVSLTASEPFTRPYVVDQASCTGVHGQNGSAKLVLHRARHPVVEEALDGGSFIPNDIDLRRDVDSDVQGDGPEPARQCGALAIVTGPNMGGKSTYIRTAGVIALMAHCGCFVPASYAQVPILDRILARVGAGDNQMRGVSTFMAEMLETAVILRAATSQSLIIIDELGRGTSTYDGFGLAYAIADHIHRRIGAQCLFATHFHELTALEADAPLGAVKNLHVSAEPDESGDGLVFLYKVMKGPCDRSFGIHVARIAGFPESVLERARKRAAVLEDFGNAARNADEATSSKRAKLSHALRDVPIEQLREFLAAYEQLPSDGLGSQMKASTSIQDLARRMLPI
ncbi:DNA mismatch repair protein msh-2 [Porphyridium purpureum]|uniref:DNA mismatch repair protein msh-2 n=1 Tax=Porphyridium purpureum TaxID=35688 RepID=A0A5J4YJ80_PORPP|nr:DNA mismatch repair protein msh-2 [Porphyridium purpureum]|eukprot:POR3631..scf291_13